MKIRRASLNIQTSRRFLAKLAARRAAVLLPLGTVLFIGQSAQAANVIRTLTTTGNSNLVSAPTAVFTNGSPNAASAGDVLLYNTVGTAANLNLDGSITIGSIKNTNTGTLSILAGGGTLTLDGTGISGGNTASGTAGRASIYSTNSTGTVTVNAPIVLNTAADFNTNSGATGSTLTIGGTVNAATGANVNLNLRVANGTSLLTLSGNVGTTGTGTIALTHSSAGGGATVVSGSLGSQVSSVTNTGSGNVPLYLTGTSSTFSGGVTQNSTGIIQAQNTAAANTLTQLGTGTVMLNGGTLNLRANGTANNGTIVTGTGAAGGGNNVTVGGNTIISADRITTTVGVPGTTGTFTGNTFQFNNLILGANVLTVSNANTYGVQFAGTTTVVNNSNITTNGLLTINAMTVTDAATTGTTSAFTFSGTGTNTVNGVISDNATDATKRLSITKVGSGTLNLNGANTFSGGLTQTINNITGANTGTTNVLQAFGTGTITLSGGTLNLRANGSASSQQIITGNGTTGNNVLYSGGTIDVNRPSANSNSDFVFNNLTFGAGTSTFAVTGGNGYGVRFAGTPTVVGNTVLNVSSALIFDNALTDGASNSFNLTKTSGGVVALGGANAYTGATVINGGTLALGSGAGQGATVVGGTAALAGGSILITSDITLNQTGGLTIDDTAGTTNRIADTQAITFNQNGRLNMIGGSTANSNAVSTETVGNLNFNAGDHLLTINSGNANSVTTLAAASVSRNDLATVLVRGSNLNQTAGSAVGRITLADGGASLGTLVGTNTLSNGATNDATQGLKIVPWMIGDTALTGAGTHFVTYDATLGLRVLTTAQETALTAGYATPAVAPNATSSGAVAITAADPTVNSLMFLAASTLSGSGTLTVNSGAVGSGNFANTLSGFTALALGNGEGIFNIAGNTTTVNVPINVISGGITKAGPGNLVLGSAANTFTGPVTINQGNVTFAAGINNALNGTTGTDVHVNAGTLAVAATTQTVQNLTFANNGAVSFAAGGVLNLAGNVTYDASGNGTGSTLGTNGTVNLNGTRTFTVGDSGFSTAELAVNSPLANGTVAGSGVTKAGEGKLDLNAANTFTGDLTINAGAVLLANAAAPGGGTIQLAGGTLAAPVSLLTNNSNWNNPVNVTGVANFVATADQSNGFHTGALTGNGTLIAPASVNLNGGTQNNTSSLKYNGDMSAFAGTFIVNTNTNVILQGAANSGSALARFQINGAGGGLAAFTPASLQTAPVTFNMGELSGASTGGIVGSNGNANLLTLSVGALNTNSTYNGILANGGGTGGGPLALTKVGTGTLTLTGVNTLSGGTTVNGGTLLVNNATGSGTGTGAVTVSNAGSILGGTGTISGAVTVNSAATIQGGAGAATGALTLSGNLTLASGSIIQLALGAGGTHSTLARTGGTWTFDPDQDFTFLLAGATTGLYDNIISGLAADPGNTANWDIIAAGVMGSFSYDGAGGIDLNITAVPEPGTVAAGLLALGTLGVSQRRRVRRFLTARRQMAKAA